MKKILYYLIPVMIFTNFILFSFKPIKSNAVGVDTFLRVAAGSEGERIIAGIAEKAGVKYATKTAREKAVQRWNMDVYEKIQEYEKVGKQFEAEELERLQNMVAQVNKAEVIDMPAKSGFGKFAMDSALFLLGADIILDGYENIKSAIETDKTLKAMEDLKIGILNGTKITSWGGLTAKELSDSIEVSAPTSSDRDVFGGSGPAWIEVQSVTSGDSTYFVEYKLFYNYFGLSTANGNALLSKAGIPDYMISEEVPSPSQVPEVSPLPWTTSVPSSPPEEMPSRTPIIIPETADYPEEVSESWNDPLEDLVPEPVEVPGEDPTEDPTEDPSDNPTDETPTSTPEDTQNRFSKLFTNKFPFSLPWDLANVFGAINAPAKVPEFGMDENRKFSGKNVPFKFHIKMDYLDPYRNYWRYFLDLSFLVFMILSVRKLFGGGQ